MPRPEDPAPDLRLLLWKAGRAVSRNYRARVAEMDLTAGQAASLLFLAESPGSTLGHLAQGIAADLATTSAMIDRLMTMNLVRRETDRLDRRRASLYPTEPALILIDRLAQTRKETAVYLEGILGPEKSERLADLLKLLIDQVSDYPDVVEEKVAEL
jgi:DNA-binding MarR family transcriptional regulator